MNKQEARTKANFSQELEELRNLAVYLTKDTGIHLKYDAKAETCSFDHKENLIVLTTNAYPDYVKNNERICRKLLDSSCAHEAGHRTKTVPLLPYVERHIQRLKLHKRSFPELFSLIVNTVEDKRINIFNKDRYRFDVGKRQELKELIFKDQIETNLAKELKDPKITKAGLLLGAIGNKTLYNVDITPILAKLDADEQKDVQEALRLCEAVKYKSLRIDVFNTYVQIYDLIAKHIKEDANAGQLMVRYVLGSGYAGKLIKGDVSDALKQALAQIVKEEEDAEKKLEEDLKKGEGAGQGTGLEIPPPEPDIAEYEQIVASVKPEIDRLLGKLKRIMKPIVSQEIYQRQGRIMANILARSYINSLHRNVQNIYVKRTVKLEKEKIALGMIIDFSGSVDKETALKITTILTEVFGNFVEDYGFAIGAFGENCQRIKSFFEEFNNTRARIANINVSSCGTRLHDLLVSFLKMFNNIHEERRKVLVIASDFSLCDQEESEKVIEAYSKSGIELVFMGFDSCKANLNTFASKIKAKRTEIDDIANLPERFLDVYLESQK